MAAIKEKKEKRKSIRLARDLRTPLQKPRNQGMAKSFDEARHQKIPLDNHPEQFRINQNTTTSRGQTLVAANISWGIAFRFPLCEWVDGTLNADPNELRILNGSD